LTRYWAEKGWSIVSGLALGCDAIAHRTAVEVRAHTVAVLAHGLHTIAPAQHRKLPEDILEAGGALESEFPFGKAPLPAQFAKRDRTQAGLAQAVLPIQSDLTGGSSSGRCPPIHLLSLGVPDRVCIVAATHSLGAKS
jgi:DNA processing protein